MSNPELARLLGDVGRELRQHARTRQETWRWTMLVRDGSVTGPVLHTPTGRRGTRSTGAFATAEKDLVWRDDLPLGTLELTAHPDGTVRGLHSGVNDGSHFGSLHVGVVRLPEARPSHRPVHPPLRPLSPRVADNDLDALRALLEQRGHTAGYGAEEIEAAEQSRGVRFPDELRLFFSLVREGEVLGADDDVELDDDEDEDEEVFAPYAVVREGLHAGTGELGNVVDPARRWDEPGRPLPVPPPAQDDDAVQPALADPGWVAFADDGGGNHYVLDLVPGPAGAVGQVLQFNMENTAAPYLVARSLTDFLRGDWVEDDGAELWEPAYPPTGSAAAPEGAVEVEIGADDDLAAWRGAPALESAVLVAPHPDDHAVVASWPRLRMLTAPAAFWAELLARDAVPATLTVAAVRDSDDLDHAAHLDVVDGLRTRSGLDPVDRDAFEVPVTGGLSDDPGSPR
ncbi:SMI1/KNR4 family protein [Nocardioides sp. CPCC 205120]|uniref:SMI1/KNR4 family protein n=1 Tax=Nocardioides sp. CPCC 205120 TaxID=3406462 RepID=UPI003B50FBFF